MVIERGTSLKEIERTGIEISGLVTSQLLINIFEHNTPLHDGAVVIRGNRVAAATCYPPLSDNMSINKALGTRHRAAVGVSETTDSLTIVVSGGNRTGICCRRRNAPQCSNSRGTSEYSFRTDERRAGFFQPV